MYNIDWQAENPEDIPRFLAEIGPKLEGIEFDPNTTEVFRHDLPFYAEYDLLRITDSTQDPVLEKLIITNGEELQVLNWANQPIYVINEKSPIHITDETVKDYVKFFFDHVRGRHGRFLIVENPSEINWKDQPPEKGLKALEKMIKPLEIIEAKSDTVVSLDSYMIFKDSLFKASVHVERDGMVSLSDEQLVVEGMPIIEDPAPGENFSG